MPRCPVAHLLSQSLTERFKIMRSNPDQSMAEYRAAMRPRSSARMHRRCRERPFPYVPGAPNVTRDEAGRQVSAGRDGLTVRTMPDFTRDSEGMAVLSRNCQHGR